MLLKPKKWSKEMVIQLNPAAESVLTSMRLSDSDKTQVRTCILRYVGTPGICGTLSWIVYRIVNAIKHLFGISDWQLCEKRISNRLKTIAEEEGIYVEAHHERIQNLINEETIGLLEFYTQKMLSLCYEIQKNNTKLGEEFLQRFTPMGLDRVLGEIRSIRNSVLVT